MKPERSGARLELFLIIVTGHASIWLAQSPAHLKPICVSPTSSIHTHSISAFMSTNTPSQDGETATSSSSTIAPTTHSPQFWFDDGNIILQSENVQFRIHRSVLSMHSNVMKDCFSYPQPSDGPAVKGCPVVHVSDSAQDIENLCSLLYARHM